MDQEIREFLLQFKETNEFKGWEEAEEAEAFLAYDDLRANEVPQRPESGGAEDQKKRRKGTLIGDAKFKSYIERLIEYGKDHNLLVLYNPMTAPPQASTTSKALRLTGLAPSTFKSFEELHQRALELARKSGALPQMGLLAINQPNKLDRNLSHICKRLQFLSIFAHEIGHGVDDEDHTTLFQNEHGSDFAPDKRGSVIIARQEIFAWRKACEILNEIDCLGDPVVAHQFGTIMRVTLMSYRDGFIREKEEARQAEKEVVGYMNAATTSPASSTPPSPAPPVDP